MRLPHEIMSIVKLESRGDQVEILGKKGPIISTAIVAGVMAAKSTASLIPFCHQVSLESCDINVTSIRDGSLKLQVDCIVKTTNKTGVEMEALVGASSTALCIYDMLKAISHNIVITDIHLLSKTGGKSDIKATF